MPIPKKASDVVWLIAARQQLRRVLARLLAENHDDPVVDEHIERSSGILRDTFPDAAAIIVRDRMQGFQPREDLDVLLVEVVPRDESTARAKRKAQPRLRTPEATIVKVAHGERDADGRIDSRKVEEKLAKEWNAWESVPPPGMSHDSQLSGLRCGPTHFKTGHPLSLIYDDAHNVLGSSDVRPLEDACVGSVRFGSPSLFSLCEGLRRLCSRLGDRFYSVSYPLNGSESLAAGRKLRERLDKTLADWKDNDTGASKLEDRDAEPTDDVSRGIPQTERLRYRREALALLSHARSTFLDPYDLLQSYASRPALSPRLLHGCSHGDLHGRNVLVGISGGKVGSFAVFDYEDMGDKNVVGWDFVKLETELKVRLYEQLRKSDFCEFVREIHEWEVKLAQLTERMHEGDIPEIRRELAKISKPRFQRFLKLMLCIREEAQEQLGRLRNRKQEWLEEYYFLLALYGMYAARFAAYQPRQTTAAYIAAGVAARRLDRPWRLQDLQVQESQRQATEWLRENHLDVKEARHWIEHRSADRVSYRDVLAFAQRWSRANVENETERPFIKAGAELLEEYRAKFPHVAEFDEELALVYRELGENDHAEEVLDGLNRRYRHLGEESLCRLGAQEKRSAATFWSKGDVPGHDARAALKRAAAYYERAAMVRNNYYPKINCASLLFLLGEVEKARVLAKEVLEQLPAEERDPVWSPATRGEALVLLGLHEEAEASYRQAATNSRCESQNRKAMADQLQLLRRVMDDNGKEFWTDLRITQVFSEVRA